MDPGPFLTDEDRLRSYREFVRKKSESQRQYRAKLKAEREQRNGQNGPRRKYERRKYQISGHQDENTHQQQHSVSPNSPFIGKYQYVQLQASEEEECPEEIEAGEEELLEDVVVEEDADTAGVDTSVDPDEQEDSASAAVVAEYEYSEGAAHAIEIEEEEIVDQESQEATGEEAVIIIGTEQTVEDNRKQFNTKRSNILRLIDSLPKDVGLIYLTDIENMLENALAYLDNEEATEMDAFSPKKP